jgi:hypothetical protein
MLRRQIPRPAIRAELAGLSRRRFVVAISVLAVSMLGSGWSALASEPSKSQYIARADAICTGEGKLLAPYAEKYSQLTSGHSVNYGRAAIILSESDAVRSAALVKLRALPAPAGAGATLAGIWNTFDRLITDTDEVATALGGRDIPTVANLDADAELTGGKYQLEAQAYGFKVCGASHR